MSVPLAGDSSELVNSYASVGLPAAPSEPHDPAADAFLREQLATTEELARVGSWTWDRRIDQMVWSAGLFRIHGVAPGQVDPTFNGYLKRVHPADQSTVAERVNAAVTGEVRTEFQERIVRPDRSIRTIHTVVREVRSEAEGVIGAVAACRDITEKRRVEEALRTTETRFRALFDQFPYSIQIFSPEGDTLATNRAWEQLFGLTPEAVASFNPLEDPQLAPILEFVKRGFEGEALVLPATIFDPRPYAVGSERSPREPFWVEAAVCPVRTPDGSVEEVFIVHRDVSEERTARERLRISEASYRAIFELAGDAIFVHDVETGAILDANRKALELHGIESLETLQQVGVPGISGGDPDSAATLSAGMMRAAAGQTQVFEWLARHTSGREFWVEVNLSRAVILGDERLVAVVRNIEDRKQAQLALQESYEDLENRVGRRTAELAASNQALEQEIRVRRRTENALQDAIGEAERARAAAEKANHAKSDFLSRMSHELRTPLNGILGFAQLLERRGLSGSEQRSVDQILRAGRHLLNLINEVLDIARIEARRESFSLEPVMVAHAVSEAIQLVRPLATEHGCHLDEAVIDPALYVRADRRRLVQILLNLLSNAIKYNRAGGHVRVRVVEITSPDPRRIRVEVEDEGAGVEAHQLDRLFSPFDRLGAEESSIEGTGLGLALSRGLAEAMDGALDVRSTLGHGSTFRLDLPATEALPPAGPPTDAARPIDENAPAVHGVVLYIEDNLANLNLVESCLESRPGISVMAAQQGGIGLDLALQHRPDLILLDLHLPDMDGIAVLTRLRATDVGRSIPVVVISADALSQTARRLRDADADAYLTKPIDVDEFLAVVDRMLTDSPRGGPPLVVE